MEKETILNVTVLNGYLHNIFCAEELLHNIKVCGEISGFRISKEHAYFTLKDQNAQIACTCFHCAKTYSPRDGESVIVTGSVDYYEKLGKLSFIASEIKPIGAGLLALQFEHLKAKLTQEGLFDQSRKIAVPTFCKRVCVITSSSGAVIRDIVTTVRRRNGAIDLVLYDVKVQGKDCAAEITRALKTTDRMGFDAIIVARGGGSMEDLMPFNDETLVRTLADMKTPIVSAVGHETDFTLCDFAADVRCATPTAAAQLIAYDTAALAEKFTQYKNTVRLKLEWRAKQAQSEYYELFHRLERAVTANYSEISIKLELYKTQLNYASDAVLRAKTNELQLMTQRLSAANPAALLSQGYWRAEKGGTALKSVAELNEQDEIDLTAWDGTARAKIIKVEKKRKIEGYNNPMDTEDGQ